LNVETNLLNQKTEKPSVLRFTIGSA